MDNIAFIIPYVNGNDPAWKQAFVEAGGKYDDSMEHGWPRYKDAGVLSLLLDSIDKFAKWADIYMIVAMPSQIPECAKNRNVKFIYHSDFLPEQFQPCVFQSNAIETFIGRMNLPEKFVWLNDDYCFTNYVLPTDFFDKDGNPLYTIKLENDFKTFWSSDWNLPNYLLFFPEATNPKKICVKHGPTPMRYSWCKEMYEKYESSLLNSVGSTINRHYGQVNQLAYSLYQWLWKTTKESPLNGRCITVKIDLHNIPFIYKTSHWVCINENSTTGFDSSKPISMLKNHIDAFKPILSIIIPIYNTAEYLPRCVESLLNQSVKNIEIILVDDGSTDESLSIALKYSEIDSRIIVVNLDKHYGHPSQARNVGMGIAKSNVLAFVDSDDYVHKNFFSSLLRLMNSKVDMVRGMCRRGEKKIFANNKYGYIIGTIIKKDFVLKHELKFRNRLHEDKYFYRDVVSNNGEIIDSLDDKNCYYYTIREGSRMNRSEKYIKKFN